MKVWARCALFSISINILGSLNHCIAQAADQKPNTLNSFIFIWVWHLGESSSHAMDVNLSHFPLVLFSVNSERDLLAFVRWIPLAKTSTSQASLYLQMIYSLFYLTVSCALGRTSTKSVLTVPKLFKWLLFRQCSDDAINKKPVRHRAEIRYFTIASCDFKAT